MVFLDLYYNIILSVRRLCRTPGEVGGAKTDTSGYWRALMSARLKISSSLRGRTLMTLMWPRIRWDMTCSCWMVQNQIPSERAPWLGYKFAVWNRLEKNSAPQHLKSCWTKKKWINLHIHIYIYAYDGQSRQPIN